MSEYTPIPNDDAPYLDVTDQNQLVLVKRGQRYVFDCPLGHETDLLQELRAMVADPNNDLNWFDAAVLSHQLGQRMSDRLSELYQNRRPA
ncbi:MAG: hypothetical protein AAF333_12620 [Planctomycetota bacterium]